MTAPRKATARRNRRPPISEGPPAFVISARRPPGVGEWEWGGGVEHTSVDVDEAAVTDDIMAVVADDMC